MTAEQERQSASLMRLAQAGDQVAYASLLVLLMSTTRQFARTRLGAVPWIDDVVQAWSAALATLASVALGAAATQFLCPIDDPAHQLVGHVLPARFSRSRGRSWDADR